MKGKRIITALLAAVFMITQAPVTESRAASGVSLSGKAHVQTYADQTGMITKEDGIDTLVLGTRGQAKRVESVTIRMENNTGYAGTIQYRVHRQTYGWTDWLESGQPAGTTGEAKRLEAIQIRLTGELGKHYDVRYRVHIQTYGDNQGWIYNGALAGTTGEAKRLEEVKVQIIPKNTVNETPGVSYRVHRQTYGWETQWARNGKVAGTTGEAKRLEAISIDVKGSSYAGSIQYQTHVQSYGWMDWVADGALSGTSGEAKRLEAIRIQLTGELAENYDIYYRVHAQTFGWMGWAKNGEAAGTAGYAKRLEAIQIVLVKKGNAAPAASYAGVTQATSAGFRDADSEDKKQEDAKPEENGNSQPDDNRKPAGNDEKPVWHPEKTQTVTYYQCDNCKCIFRTEEELEQHYDANDPKYNIESACADRQGGRKTQTFIIQDGYWSNEDVTEEYQVVWMTEQEATQYEADVIDKVPYTYCSLCKKRFYTDGMAEDGEDQWDHYWAGCKKGIIGGDTEERIVGHETVIDPEYGHYEIQLIK